MGETRQHKPNSILMYGFLALFSIAGAALTVYLAYQFILFC
jgi:hypothetical protein